MSGGHLNLAGRPFVNNRPVTRLTVVLWTAAAAFLIADALLFWGTWRGQEDQRRQLAEVQAEVVAERAKIGDLGRELATVDVAQLNRRTELLNEKIAERTFGWGQLFDHLTALLPADVRLTSLTPQPVTDPGRSRRRPRAAAGVTGGTGDDRERVRLEILGTARRDDAILELLDALFADPAFESPNLARESKEQNEVRFSLSAIYLPAVAAARDAAGGDDDDAATDTGAAAPATDPVPATPPGSRS